MITVDKNYSVKSDSKGCTLIFEGTPYIKNGKTVTPKDRWFYNNLEQCLNKYIDQVMVGEEVESVKDALVKIKDARETIKNI